MSEPKEVRGISPLMQSQLMSQIQDVRHALNEGHLHSAYRAVKVLILISPPQVQDNGVLKKLEEFDNELEEAQKAEGVDLKKRREARVNAIQHVYRERIIPLFYETMRQLYGGGYMEFYAKDVDTNIPKRLLETALDKE